MSGLTSTTVGHRLTELALREPDHNVLSIGSHWVTLKELNERTDRLSAGLASLGIGHGDRVALVLPNCMAAAETIFACAKLGAIAVPLNAYLKGEFLRYQLHDADPSVACLDASAAEALAGLNLDLTGLKATIGVGQFDGSDSRTDIGYEELLTTGYDTPTVPVRPQDPLAIFYTSGTTGMPKGCLIAHGYAFNGARAHYHFGHTREDDVIATALPLFHAAAFSSMMDTIGGVRCAISLETEFRASTFLSRARDKGATVIRGVGAMGVALLGTTPSDADREHSIERAHFFPLGSEMREAFEQRFGIAMISGGYGQTECNPAVHTSYEDRHQPTAGRALPWIELRIVDDEDNELPTGQVGEIVLRNKEPYGLFSGYWRKESATLESSRNLWHHTGDYGRLDDAGYLTFVDRKKDALRRRGENVSSIELEKAILAHPTVRQVAVHAVASEVTEDDIKACIVLAENAAISPQELFDFFEKSLPYYAIPRYVEVMDQLPENAVSRVQKHILRARGNGPGVWDFEELGMVVRRDHRR
ncbi:AMP-binding protein [Nocardia vinacea]|uniref:AMP-binding protein n=1 Tax=Nocardia vinacea TaxID=96468 RepID=A0ABZ1YXH6_9NOCA|nr:AMP-binding protein [Nocardia vinacea]